MSWQVEEIATAGFDDFAQTVGDGFGLPTATGLRVPPAVLPVSARGLRPAYRFLLAVADFGVGDMLVGLGTLAVIGSAFVQLDHIPPPSLPLLLSVTSETWRYPDGSTTWTLTEEARTDAAKRKGPLDQASFVFEDCDTPALVYETASFPAAPAFPGYVGLTGYTPPGLRGDVIAAWRDQRYPWQKRNARIRRVFDRPTRVRLYCDVVQTDAQTRVLPVLGFPAADQNFPIAGMRPEDLHMYLFANSSQYWSVAGRLTVRRRRGEE